MSRDNDYYDFSEDSVQATILQDNVVQAVIDCQVEKRVAKAYQNFNLMLTGGLLALTFFGGGLLMVTAAKDPTPIVIKQPD